MLGSQQEQRGSRKLPGRGEETPVLAMVKDRVSSRRELRDRWGGSQEQSKQKMGET